MTPGAAQVRIIIDMALGEPLGLVLRTTNFVKARGLFYAVRRQMVKDAPTKAVRLALMGLQFRASGIDDGDLLIIRGAHNDDQETSETLLAPPRGAVG